MTGKNSVLEILIIDLLRQQGVLTPEQVSEILSVQHLYDLLVTQKVISPLSASDRLVVDKIQGVVVAKISLEEKIDMLKDFLNGIEDDTLQKTLRSLIANAEKLS